MASGVSGLNPEIMGLGPIEACRQALKRAGMTIDDIDLVEINEAFAAQVIPSAKHLGIPLEKLNIRGGAIALGHPFGMTGARIMTTLLNSLEDAGQAIRHGVDVRGWRPGHGHDRRAPGLKTSLEAFVPVGRASGSFSYRSCSSSLTAFASSGNNTGIESRTS